MSGDTSWIGLRGEDVVAVIERLKQIKHRVPLTGNAPVKSFNGSLRDKFLNVHWFLSLEDAQEKI